MPLSNFYDKKCSNENHKVIKKLPRTKLKTSNIDYYF